MRASQLPTLLSPTHSAQQWTSIAKWLALSECLQSPMALVVNCNWACFCVSISRFLVTADAFGFYARCRCTATTGGVPLPRGFCSTARPDDVLLAMPGLK